MREIVQFSQKILRKIVQWNSLTPFFEASCLQRSEISAGMELQKGGLGVLDVWNIPEEPIDAVEKSF